MAPLISTKITNYNSSVGFFANSNHLATLYLDRTRSVGRAAFWSALGQPGGRGGAWKILRAVVFLFFIVNLILNTSVAGYGLSIAATIYWVLRIEKVRQTP